MSDFQTKTRNALRRQDGKAPKSEAPKTNVRELVELDLTPRPIERRFYHHYKGGLYYVHGIGTHTETGEELVFYQHVGGKFYARPMSSWRQKASVNRPPPIHRSQVYVERFRLLPEDFKMVP